jgi:hypothetical protein
MLHCREGLAAMQTAALFWHLVYIRSISRVRGAQRAQERKGNLMSRTASAALHTPSNGLFGRLFAAVDRLLLAYAKMAIRNGDIPRHGI